VRVEVRAAGRRKPLVPEWSVPVPVDPGGGGDGGVTLRLGWQLPDDFDVPRPLLADTNIGVHPVKRAYPRNFTCYFFLHVGATALANVIMMDGNTFDDSAEVDHTHHFFRGVAGVTARYDFCAITFSGHAMLDLGYQTEQGDPDWFDVLRPTKLPSRENQFGDDGKFFASVRQSRLGVSTQTPTALGELNTLVEFELFGVGDDAGETTFRLRHAWGELGQFGAGQYWSAFMDIDVFPNSIEYWGPNAMVFYRNAQARWTPWRDGAGSRLALSLERPGGSGGESELDSIIDRESIEADFELPDLAAHYRHAGDWGHVQLAALLRQIKWADTGDDELDLSGEETGWGLNLSTNLRFGTHVFRGSLVHGEGIQNYMNDANADVGVVLTGDQARPFRGEAIPLTGAVAFLDLNWSEQWTSTVGYAVQTNDLPDRSTPDSFEKGEYALLNLLYHPHPQVLVGPEIQWGRRENFNGFSVDDLRLQFSAKYSFSKSLLTR